jgi:hypothetical protein
MTKPTYVLLAAALVATGLGGAVILTSSSDCESPTASRSIETIRVARAPEHVIVGSNCQVWVGHANGCCSSGNLTRIDANSTEILGHTATGEPVRGLAEVDDRVYAVSGAERTIMHVNDDGADFVEALFKGENQDPHYLAGGEGSLWVGLVPLGISVSDAPRSIVRRVELEASRTSGLVAEYDVSRQETVGFLEVPHAPVTAIAFAHDSLWVASAERRSVYRIDPQTEKVLARVKLNGAPGDLAVGADSIWVTLPQRAEVARIDSTSNGVAGPIADTGDAVKQLAVGGGYVWGVLRGRDRVVRIDVSSQRIVGSPISVGDRPSDIAVGHGFAWVVNRRDNTVTRIPTTYPVSG